MTEYYFDMETTGIDFDKDEIITIQWQMLNGHTGDSIGELNVLKGWEYPETEILRTFAPNLMCKPFDFIIVGKNLLFDFCFLNKKMAHYGFGEFDIRCMYQRVSLDIKPILVLMNNGNFVGYDMVVPKRNPLRNDEIPTLFRQRRYPEILQYIKDESKDLIEVYKMLKREMPSFKKRLFKE